MTQYDNNLKGALFKHKDAKDERDPAYRGQCEIDGVGYFIDAWINESKTGEKYMSLRFKAKEKNRQAGTKARPSRDDSDLPPF